MADQPPSAPSEAPGTGSDKNDKNDQNDKNDKNDKKEKAGGIAAFMSVFDWMQEHKSPTTAGLVAVLVALFGALGPICVERIREPIERQKVHATLVNKIVETAVGLDPNDFRSVVRLGVVADLVGENERVFSLQISKAARRLDDLARELKRGSVGTMLRSIDSKTTEIVRLEEAQRVLERQRDATREQEARNAVVDLMNVNQRLIDTLKRARDEEKGDFDRFVERLGKSTNERSSALESVQDQLKNLATVFEKGNSLDQAQREKMQAELEQIRNSTATIAQNTVAVAEQTRLELERLRAEREALAKKVSKLERALTAAQEEATSQQRNEEELRRRLAGLGVTIRRGPGGLAIVVQEGADGRGLVRFRRNQSTIIATKELGNLVGGLKTAGSRSYQIQGHTDDLGKNNWTLSTQRALSLLNFLTTKSTFVPEPMDRGLFSVAGYAETKPLDPAKTEAARAKNRRVEIVLLPPDTANLVEMAIGDLPRR
jgi:chemotaxis protein MotB